MNTRFFNLISYVDEGRARDFFEAVRLPDDLKSVDELDGSSLLHVAAGAPSDEIFHWLVTQYKIASIATVKNKRGLTPISIAERAGRFDRIAHLQELSDGLSNPEPNA